MAQRRAASSAGLGSAFPTRTPRRVGNAQDRHMAMAPTQYPGTEQAEPWGLTGGGWHVSLAANPWSLLSKPRAEQGLPHALAAPVECLQLPVCGGGQPGDGGVLGSPLHQQNAQFLGCFRAREHWCPLTGGGADGEGPCSLLPAHQQAPVSVQTPHPGSSWAGGRGALHPHRVVHWP